MKLGATTYAFAWNIGIPGWPSGPSWSALDVVHYCSDLGLKHIQFCENLALLDLPSSERSEVLSTCDRLGITLDLGMRGIDANRVEAHAELSAQLGASWIRLVIDQPGDHPSLAEAESRLMALQPMLERRRVGLAIENHDRFPSLQLASMVERLGSRFAICLDTANSLGSLEGPRETVLALAPHSAMLHFKDVAAVRLPHMLGFEITGRAAGEGGLDAAWILGEVARHKRLASVLLEQWPAADGDEPAWVVERAMAEASARNLARLLKQTGLSS